MLPQDYHIHSTFSCDSHTPMAEMCQAALAKGIAEIGFAEHYDLHPDEPMRDWFRLEAWVAELENCRAAFAGRLILRAGIELGEPHVFTAETQSMLARYPFDYALGSLHWVGQECVFDHKYFHRPADEAFRLYFEELERMTSIGGFDILSHLDVVARVGLERYGAYEPRRYEDQIRPVLRNCIERGLALDLNAAGLRRNIKKLMPGLDILRWYVEMGGERVTLGSDAHHAAQIGAQLEAALEIARAAGLKYLTHFEKRQARLAPLA